MPMHVIYGGTFDPVHHGHLRLALEVSDRLGGVPINLVPCHIPSSGRDRRNGGAAVAPVGVGDSWRTLFAH